MGNERCAIRAQVSAVLWRAVSRVPLEFHGSFPKVQEQTHGELSHALDSSTNVEDNTCPNLTGQHKVKGTVITDSGRQAGLPSHATLTTDSQP